MRTIKFRAWDKKKEKMFYSGDEWGDTYLEHRIIDPIEVSSRGIEINVPAGGNDYIEIRKEKRTETFYGSWDYDAVYRIVELMQYTNLKDKNGKEIYEGDIIKYHARKGLEDTIYKVEWGIHKQDFDGGVYKYLGIHFIPIKGWLKSITDGLSFPTTEEMEIIGNVYEHPNLLN